MQGIVSVVRTSHVGVYIIIAPEHYVLFSDCIMFVELMYFVYMAWNGLDNPYRHPTQALCFSEPQYSLVAFCS